MDFWCTGRITSTLSSSRNSSHLGSIMHECRSIVDDYGNRSIFYCIEGDFSGSLQTAIEHIVKNQFVVEPPKHDNRDLKLGRSRNSNKYT